MQLHRPVRRNIYKLEQVPDPDPNRARVGSRIPV